MEKYGCDKPDLRIPLHLVEISELVMNEEFKVFSSPAQDEKSRVVALKIPGGNSLSRGKIDEYTKYVSTIILVYHLPEIKCSQSLLYFVVEREKNSSL